jgi:hypothetical protein
MTPREIIAEAWAITRREPSLRRWGCTTAFFKLLLNLKLISYQVYFLWEYLSGHEGGGFFDIEIAIYNSMPHWFFWSFIIFFTLLFIVELFFPHLSEGAIIGLAAKSHRKEEVKGGLVLGLYNFFPVFAIHEIFLLGSLSTLITVSSVLVRYIDGDLAYPIVIILSCIWLFSNILKFFFGFAAEAAVIRKIGVFEALGQSFKLIISYLGQMVFLLLLLLVISIRILLNTVLVILIPGIVIGVGIVLAFFFSAALSYTIAGFLGIVLIGITSYFFGYLEVFNQTVWTITYMELSKHKELDKIE